LGFRFLEAGALPKIQVGVEGLLFGIEEGLGFRVQDVLGFRL